MGSMGDWPWGGETGSGESSIVPLSQTASHLHCWSVSGRHTFQSCTPVTAFNSFTPLTQSIALENKMLA